jgi:hypothetical protein
MPRPALNREGLNAKFQLFKGYFGCNICAIITWQFSAMLSSSRTSLGFFACDIWSISSCSFSPHVEQVLQPRRAHEHVL